MEEVPSPIRILHVTFNMGIGGTEQVIRQLVMGLPADEYINHVVCIDGHVGEIGQQLERQAIQVSSLKRSPGIDRNLVKGLKEKIRTLGIDIVHCHQYTPWFYGWLAARGTGTPLIFTEHGRFHPDTYRYKALAVNPVMALSTSALVAISDATRSALSRYEFIPKSLIQVLYNGVQAISSDSDAVQSLKHQLGIPEGDFVMGTVARLDPVKNQQMMLKGFARTLAEYPDSWMLIVGDGPVRRQLEDLSRGLDITERVIFTGFQSEPANYMAAMDLFLLTSFTEGTSMTLLESMSLGIPAIATDVGGNSEIVAPEVSGVLVPSDDADALARSIDRLRKDPALMARLQQGSRQRFDERFSVTNMVSAYRDIYLHNLRRR